MASQDLRSVAIEVYELISRGDVTRLAELLPSDESLPVIVGTAPDEWFEGRAAALDALEQQARDYPKLRFEPRELHCEETGDSGWVVDRPSVVMPDGSRIDARQTSVFKREAGTWRLVHSHLSIGMQDE
jgi:ketosteroid isomerase-like protein